MGKGRFQGALLALALSCMMTFVVNASAQPITPLASDRNELRPLQPGEPAHGYCVTLSVEDPNALNDPRNQALAEEAEQLTGKPVQFFTLEGPFCFDTPDAAEAFAADHGIVVDFISPTIP